MKWIRRFVGGAVALVMMTASVSCVQMTHKLEQDKPLEINVNVKIQRELDDFYSFQDKYDPATQPSTAPSMR